MLALIATLWAYDGWNDLTMVAGEVRRPERSLPIALIGGLFIVGVLFMATNAAIQYILPAAQIAASERPAVAALSVVAGPRGAGFVAAAMALSIFVTLNGTIMSGARIPFAAARDRLFFRQFAHINPRFQSPSTSLIVQGLLSTVLLLFLSTIPAALRTRRLRRVALLHAHRDHSLRVSPPSPRPGPPLSRLGISRSPRHLRPLRRRRPRLQLRRQSREDRCSAPPSSSSASPSSGSSAKNTARPSHPTKATAPNKQRDRILLQADRHSIHSPPCHPEIPRVRGPMNDGSRSWGERGPHKQVFRLWGDKRGEGSASCNSRLAAALCHAKSDETPNHPQRVILRTRVFGAP